MRSTNNTSLRSPAPKHDAPALPPHDCAHTPLARPGDSSLAKCVMTAAAATTTTRRGRKETQRDAPLPPEALARPIAREREGTELGVSLRTDGFVPVLHLQGDVAKAVNALSGMQGVRARSPAYLFFFFLPHPSSPSQKLRRCNLGCEFLDVGCNYPPSCVCALSPGRLRSVVSFVSTVCAWIVRSGFSFYLLVRVWWVLLPVPG